MKILMLNYEFPPMGGGAGNATDNISIELSKMGHEVTVLTSHYKGLEKEEVKNGVKIIRVFSCRNSIHDCGLKGAYSFLLFAVIKLLKIRRKEKFDLIHYFFSLPTGLLSLMKGLFRSTPYIVSLRGSDVPYYDPYNKKVHLMNMLLKPVNRTIWRNAEAVVALSDSLKNTALRTRPNQEIDVVPNGIESGLFCPCLGPRCTDGKFSLVTVSRLINRKGIDNVIKALADIPDPSISLVIVGTGSYEENLKSLTKNLNMGDRVTFYGYCPREQLTDLYNKSDVFILPSLVESFGLVFAEAMACGLPIIGAKTGGIVDLVKSENGILVEPGSVTELKNAIIKLKNSRDTRLSMSCANRKRVVEKYSWKKIAKQYADIYQKVVMQ